MAEFKLVISDPKKGKSYQREVKDKEANSLMGLKIGNKVTGEKIELSGYEFEIRGGSDKCGFPMRKDLEGTGRKKILIVGGVGLKSKRKGMKKRKTVAGNTISQNTAQINMKILKYGKAKLKTPSPEAEEEKKEEKKEEVKEGKEEAKEEVKEKGEIKKEAKEEKKEEETKKEEGKETKEEKKEVVKEKGEKEIKEKKLETKEEKKQEVEKEEKIKEEKKEKKIEAKEEVKEQKKEIKKEEKKTAEETKKTKEGSKK